MADIKWIKIIGNGIEDVFASYNFSEDSFEVESFKGTEGTYEVSGDLPSSFPNPATITFIANEGSGKFKMLLSAEKLQE